MFKDITEMTITGLRNGVEGTYSYPAFLDLGVIDTMKDLLVNSIGALVFSVIGFFYIKNRGKSKIAGRFIPQFRKDK